MIIFPIGLYIIQKHNLNYYKINGRSPVEIECWLKKRKWYNIFKYNIQQEVINSYKDENGCITIDENIKKEIDNKVYDIICGSSGTETISDAFCWRDTLEGTIYWGKREHEFLAWYFGQYVDLHLFR